MRKKSTLSLLIIIGLSLSGMMTNALSVTAYTCKVRVGDQTILELLEIDENYSFIEGYDIGAKRKIKISNLTEKIANFQIQLQIWDTIPANEIFNNSTDYTIIFNVTKNPTKLIRAMSVVLTPVNSYLSEYVSGTPENFTSNGNILTLHFWPNSYSIIFDSNGFLSGINHTRNTILLESWVKRQSSQPSQPSQIPGYDLSIVIGLITIAVLSIVYIWKKKGTLSFSRQLYQYHRKL